MTSPRSPRRSPKPPARSSKFAGVYPSGATNWQYKVRLPRQPDGSRPIETRGGFATDSAAHEARVRRLSQIYDGIAVEAGNETIAEYMRMWLQLDREIKPASQHLNYQIFTLLIEPYLGNVRVRELAPQDVERWLDILRHEHPNRRSGEPGLSSSRVISAMRLLRAALNHAVEVRKLIPHNPAAIVRPPALRTTPAVIWTDEEIARALPVLDRDEYNLAWRLALYLQMRSGEILALTRDDIDMQHRVVNIQRTRSRNREGRITIADVPKTRSSRRSIPMTARVAEMFEERFARHDAIAAAHPLGPDGWNPERLVFPAGRRGRYISHPWFCQRLAQLCREANVPELRPHDLRHTGATWLIRRGVSPAVVSRRLGHASVTFTIDTYVHPNEDDQRAAGDALEL